MNFKEKFFSISASCIFYEKNGLWFVHSTLPVLMHVDLNSNIIDFQKVIPNEKQVGMFFFRGIFVTDDNIFLIPYNSGKIVIYSKVNDKFSFISIKDSCSNMYRGYIKEGDWLILKPSCYSKFTKFNYITKEVQYENDWKKLIGEEQCLSAAYKYGDSIIYAIWRTNKLLKYKFKDNEYEIIQLKKIYKISQIVIVDEFAYIYDMEDRSLNKYSIRKQIILNKILLKYQDVWLQTDGTNIYLTSVDYPEWIIFNLELTEILKNRDTERERKLAINFKCFEWDHDGKGNTYAIDTKNNLIKLTGNRLQKKQLELKNDDFFELGINIALQNKNKILCEEPNFRLNEFIKNIWR